MQQWNTVKNWKTKLQSNELIFYSILIMQTFSHKWKNNSQRRSIKIIRPWKFRTNLKIIKFPRTRNLWKRDLMKRNTSRKGMSVFSSSLVTCAPELCMPHTHPPSLDRYVVRIYRGRWYNRLFISTRFPIFETLCKRSWVIISRLSTRDIAGICLAPLFRKRNFHRSYLSLGYKLRRDLLFSRRSFVFNL